MFVLGGKLEENKEEMCIRNTLVGHLQGSVERLQVALGAQSCLKAVHDEDDSDVSVGVLGATQLL